MEKVKTPTLLALLQLLNAMLGHSTLAKAIWECCTGRCWETAAETRWTSTIDQVVTCVKPAVEHTRVSPASIIRFCDILEERGMCEATLPKLKALVENPRTLALILFECIVVEEVALVSSQPRSSGRCRPCRRRGAPQSQWRR